MSDIQKLSDGTRIIWSPIVRRKRFAFLTQIFGELLLTAGVVLMLFVGYKTLVQENVVAVQQVEYSKKFSESNGFMGLDEVSKDADIFGRMYVPRFGENWTRLIAEGTRWHPVLNEIGIGHYAKTAMPGEVGNFAIAAHRAGFGGAFRDIDKLTNGDRVYIETRDTWFVYRFLETEIVLPTEIGVIAEVPEKLDGATEGRRYLTMTSCTPIFVNTERIISWFELEQTYSTSLGMPADLKVALGSK
jgi:sortase A